MSARHCAGCHGIDHHETRTGDIEEKTCEGMHVVPTAPLVKLLRRLVGFGEERASKALREVLESEGINTGGIT
jgi:hypothetical protein